MDAKLICHVEVYKNKKWEMMTKSFKDHNKYTMDNDRVFDFPDDNIYAFLGGVNNISQVKQIDWSKELPKNISKELEKRVNAYITFHETVDRLLKFDYNKTFWNRKKADGTPANTGEGMIMTYREFLGKNYFKELEVLKQFGNPKNVRIVYWFNYN